MYGEQCVEIYKITANSLYEDKKDSYPSYNEAYTGDFKLMDNSLFEKVKELGNEIPAELLTTNSTEAGK